MPRKLYIQHLESLKATCDIHGVSNVRRGDDDEEFRFQVQLDDNTTNVEITALIVPCKYHCLYVDALSLPSTLHTC
jgi:hypothetical protein